MTEQYLHIVVYPICNPSLLIARFGLFGTARGFVEAYNDTLPEGSEQRVVAFDTKEWRQIWPRSAAKEA